MNNTLKIDEMGNEERIEQYLLGNMKEDDRKAFEAELSSDAGLKEQTERRRIIIGGIKAGFNTELKSKLKDEDQKRDSSRRTRRLQYISGIAAVVIIGIFSQLFINRVKHDSTKIYSDYYRPYPNVTLPISRSQDNTDNPFYQYEAGMYSKALEGLNEIIKMNPADESALFYAGITCMELLDFEGAIKYLNSVTALSQNIFTRPAYWYLSLAYLKSDSTVMAVTCLEQLTEGDDNYAKNSKKILKKIN